MAFIMKGDLTIDQLKGVWRISESKNYIPSGCS
jgi:hypothetical protein